MAYDLSGKIKTIFETQTFPSGFSKREFVVVTTERFPQDIKFDCLKEKAELLDSFKEGDDVKVSFDITGREYNGRYYNNLNAWKIVAANAADAGDTPPDDYIEDTNDYSPDDDNVPF